MPEPKPKLPQLPPPHEMPPGFYPDKPKVFTYDLARAIQAEAWNAAIEWAAKVTESDDFYGSTVQHAIALAIRKEAISAAAVPTTGDNR